MAETLRVNLTVNDRAETLTGTTATVLADALRGQLRLRGTKIACDQAVCGACTVLVNGQPTASCMTLLFTVDGACVETIENLSKDGEIHPVQRAFIEESAFQCGYCTPGMVMTVKAMFEAEPEPEAATVRRWLASNLCRCTGMASILRAVERIRLTRRGAAKAAR